jgi:23S rRNA (cytidine1920-2'-O)/16S rRNA (cytidine1409-2'-O)-methyltransferase
MSAETDKKPEKKPGKVRLDQLLVDRGLAETRTKAQAVILAGQVFSGERRLDKPGQPTPVDLPVTLRGAPHPWVSRGALKLVGALDQFALDVTGKIAIDVGSSTGGFTEVLLSRGAVKVYAVDVGKGQLAWGLRNDPRVVVMEGVNARHLTTAELPEAPGVVVCDASFIGLATVLPAVLNMAAPGALVVALIKPQFEVGKGRVGKGGIVRDPDLHIEVCDRIRDWLANEMHWNIIGITDSPITGQDGNREFLIAATKPLEDSAHHG